MAQAACCRTVAAVADLFAEARFPWAFCGRWALDLFLERLTREHEDVDVAVLRKDQLQIQSYLQSRGWGLGKVEGGRRIPWGAGELVQLPVHEIHSSNPDHSPGDIEILFNESAAGDFVFRRDARIRCRLSKAIVRARAGFPVLAPEVVLLYKAGDPPDRMGKNETDFMAVVEHLRPEQRDWLRVAVRMLYPHHAWLPTL
jgi:hypothetical protein